jgi:hypothetical protein
MMLLINPPPGGGGAGDAAHCVLSDPSVVDVAVLLVALN